jgi:hypothetical protein
MYYFDYELESELLLNYDSDRIILGGCPRYIRRVAGLRHVSTKFRYATDAMGAVSGADNLDIPDDT